MYCEFANRSHGIYLYPCPTCELLLLLPFMDAIPLSHIVWHVNCWCYCLAWMLLCPKWLPYHNPLYVPYSKTTKQTSYSVNCPKIPLSLQSMHMACANIRSKCWYSCTVLCGYWSTYAIYMWCWCCLMLLHLYVLLCCASVLLCLPGGRRATSLLVSCSARGRLGG